MWYSQNVRHYKQSRDWMHIGRCVLQMLYLCVCIVCAYVHVYVCAYVYKGVRDQSLLFLEAFHTLRFWSMLSHWYPRLVKSTRLASKSHRFACVPMPGFHGRWGLTSGPHTWAASPLAIELSPESLCYAIIRAIQGVLDSSLYGIWRLTKRKTSAF